MQKIRMIVLVLAAVAGIIGTGARAGAQSRIQSAPRIGRSAGLVALPREEPADSLYRLGRNAVTDGDYRRAANLLKQVADKYPDSKTASDALYWRAWSLHRLGVDSRSSRD